MIWAAAALGSEIKWSHAKLLKICSITLQDRIFTHRSRITPCNRSILDPRALGSPYHGRMESHYPTIRTLAVRSYSSPHVLQYYDGSLLVVPSIHITVVPLILTLLPNPWRPKSPRSAVSTRLEPSPVMSSMSCQASGKLQVIRSFPFSHDTGFREPLDLRSNGCMA